MSDESSRSEAWEILLGGEIFDRLVKKGNKLGIQGNKMLRDLQKEKFLPSTIGTKLGKTKASKMEQREHFSALSDEGLAFLRNAMVLYFNPQPLENEDYESSLEVGDISKNLRARAWHLADDPQSSGYLEVIFGGVVKEARRAQVDNKATRTEANWKHLCDNYFNSEEWKPQNPFDNSRVLEINPSQPPKEAFSPEDLRTLFSKMRSQYSIFNDRYHRSGQLVDGEGDGDDDFYSNFAGSDAVYLYAHLLFKGQAPKFCTRSLTQPCDVGLSSPPCSSVSTSGSIDSARKRKYCDLSKEDMIDIMKPSEDEIKRDQSMSTFFTLSSLDNTIKSDSFKTFPVDVQESLQKKYEDMVRNTFL